MSEALRESRLAQAVAWRTSGELDRAKSALIALRADYPDDAEVAYQLAWACDRLGHEQEAIGYYEAALSAEASPALCRTDRAGALLGLGSSYRCVGRYDDAIAVFQAARRDFPDDPVFDVFYAMAAYNCGQHREAVSTLLTTIADCASDSSIQRYAAALRFYAQRLDDRF